MKWNSTKNSGKGNQLVSLFQLATETVMVTLELKQSNHVTIRQCIFDQPILMEGIPTRFRLKT